MDVCRIRKMEKWKGFRLQMCGNGSEIKKKKIDFHFS